MSRNISDCCPEIQAAWNFAIHNWGNLHPDLTPKICCSYRSPDEQNKAYAIGRTVKGANASPSLPMGRIITNAKAGESAHNIAPPNTQAIDFFFEDENNKAVWTQSLYKEFANIMIGFDSSLIYGGSFTGIADNDHIETKNWKSFIQTA